MSLRDTAFQSRKDIAHAISISDQSLRYFLFSVRPENMYSSFEVPKKNGEKRHIDAPDIRLKNIQRSLARLLTSLYIERNSVYGFVKGKNHIKNAQKHVHSRCILNLDLKDYFSQFHFGRIVGTLAHPPYEMGREAAVTIAQISCLNGTLPQGAPTSPILTNIVCAPLDSALTRLAKKYNLLYTRYADDITFSTHKKSFPASIAMLEPPNVILGTELRAVFEKCNFIINEQKVTLHCWYQRQEVTGLVTNTKVNVRREYLKTLRAILHHCDVDGIYPTAKAYATSPYCHSKKLQSLIADDSNQHETEKLFQRILWGKINYIGSVRGKDDFLFHSFASQYNNLFNIAEFPNLASGCPRKEMQKTVVIEIQDSSGEVLSQGTGIYLRNYGLLTCHHVIDGFASFSARIINLYDPTDIGNYHLSEKDIFDSNATVDYVLFYPKHIESISYAFEKGDLYNIQIGQHVWLVSYPEYLPSHQSPKVIGAKVTQSKTKFGVPFYTVDQPIFHGSSGGAVLDTQFHLIGMIRGGGDSSGAEEGTPESGFTPLNIIMEHFPSQ